VTCVVCGSDEPVHPGNGHWQWNGSEWWACSFEHWKIASETEKKGASSDG
jgi:hypothetical protein